MEEAAPPSDINKEGEKVVKEPETHGGKQYGTVDTSDIEVNTSSFIKIKMDDAKESIEHDDATESNASEKNKETSRDCSIRVGSESTTTKDSAVDKTNLETEHTSDEILDEKCKKHPGKLLEYVCNDHDEVICRQCRDKHHSNCNSKGYIDELQDVYRMECDDYLEKGKKNLSELEDILAAKTIGYDNTKASIQLCKTALLELHNTFRCSIQSSEDQLISRLSEIELKLEREHLTDVEILESTFKEINNLVNTINDSKRKSAANSVKAAIEGRRLIKKHKKYIDNIKNKGSSVVFFEEDPSAGPFLKSFNGAGKLTEKLATENIYDNDGKNDSVQRLENFTLQRSSMSCNILVMPDNRILVSDEINGSIYCFGADGELLFDTNYIKSPLGLCHMMWNFVVVVHREGIIPLEVKGKKFSIKDKLSGDPFCAISFRSGYFVLCGENTIDVMNSHGHRKKEIPNSGGWLCRPLFSEPKAISFDDESDTKFYVTDGHQRKVLCITIDGKLLWRISVNEGSPGEITCRKYIFVLCRDSRRVLQLEKSGNLLQKYDTGYQNPCGIFVDQNMTMYMLETKEANSGRTTTKIIKKDVKECFPKITA